VSVQLTWRGEKLAYAHRSSTLFRTIHAWRVAVFDQSELDTLLDQVMGAADCPQPELSWKEYVQDPTVPFNVHAPHGIQLAREYRQELEANANLSAIIQTTITSPNDQLATLWYHSVGQTEIRVNGIRVEELEGNAELDVQPTFYKAHCTEPFALQQGRNTLLILSRPPAESSDRWRYGGMIRTPGGQEIVSLTFEA
jgi:hypothetical protein